MLKLEQIKIKTTDELIVEVLDPVVYEDINSIKKTDAIIEREKNEAFYLLAKVKHIHKEEKEYKVDDIIMITKYSISPINFPIENFNKPSLFVLVKASIFADIQIE